MSRCEHANAEWRRRNGRQACLPQHRQARGRVVSEPCDLYCPDCEQVVESQMLYVEYIDDYVQWGGDRLRIYVARGNLAECGACGKVVGLAITLFVDEGRAGAVDVCQDCLGRYAFEQPALVVG